MWQALHWQTECPFCRSDVVRIRRFLPYTFTALYCHKTPHKGSVVLSSPSYECWVLNETDGCRRTGPLLDFDIFTPPDTRLPPRISVACHLRFPSNHVRIPLP